VKPTLVAAALFCLVTTANVFSQGTRSATIAFRQFVKRLPDVDRVEVIAVNPLLTDDIKNANCTRPGLLCAPDTYPYEIGEVKNLVGDEAKSFATLWRALVRNREQNNLCLTPDHVLRFFQGERMLLESQVSTFGRQVTLPGIGVVNLDGSSTLHLFQEAVMPRSSIQRSSENFKREMMSKVGSKLTVTGLIVDRKQWTLAISYRDGDIRLVDVNLTRVNELINLGCHTAIKVTGTLDYYPGPEPQAGGVIEQRVYEHFYFRAPQIEVVRIESPRKLKPPRK
jgi:hypothetical protein